MRPQYVAALCVALVAWLATPAARELNHPTGTRQLAFSADGRSLITLYGANIRTTTCEVCGPIDEVLALAEQRITRDFTPEERAKYLRGPG